MLNKIGKEVKQLINKEGTKVYCYFAVKSTGDDYDPESKNYQYTNLNPHVFKAYVYQISPEKLVWKEYGLQEMGAVELLCDAKYYDWFKSCNKLVIDDVDYSVFKVGADNRVLIQKRAGDLIRVVLERKG